MNTIKELSASIYHQLGKAAQEQRKWEQAEEYYQQALQIKIEYKENPPVQAGGVATSYFPMGLPPQYHRG